MNTRFGLRASQEADHLACELVRVLEEEAVVGVRVDDELGVGDVAGKQVGVYGGYTRAGSPPMS
jgi:hypothetical protein